MLILPKYLLEFIKGLICYASESDYFLKSKTDTNFHDSFPWLINQSINQFNFDLGLSL